MSADRQPTTEASIVLRSRADTRRLAKLLAAALTPGDLVVLEGDLGAGKTFLVQALARQLGVPADVPVTSPTFELVHELPGRIPIVHADLYRLPTGASIDELGITPRIGNDAVVLVEWGDRFASDLGRDGLWVFLALTGGET
ncbi:MAG TPA: tRNA (adenosine(37)-N6)-threonylcarbamoyltransferase complex ATPase subunit type 1 TsaE, partial [Polyangiales bacterium]|nr:tRNA (adenosine(37)-N6)-threonylcarbamoyltransferase complex ATPase subunit type 1 TsaE [Polyangiales bacterium]